MYAVVRTATPARWPGRAESRLLASCIAPFASFVNESVHEPGTPTDPSTPPPMREPTSVDAGRTRSERHCLPRLRAGGMLPVVSPTERRKYVRDALDVTDPALVAQLGAIARDLRNGGATEEDRDIAVAVAVALGLGARRYVWKAVTDHELRDALPIELTDREIRLGRDLFAAWADRRSGTA